MGTRGFVGVVVNDKPKLMYNHWDSYPEGLGVNFLSDVRELLKDGKLRTKAEALRLVTPDEAPTLEDIRKYARFTDLSVSSGSTDEWYCVVRDLQVKIKASLNAGVMLDCGDFPSDSLFCEWGYLIDLDNNRIEVYRGFQKKPHNRGRFANNKLVGHSVGTYYPVALLALFSLNALPTDEDFVKYLNSLTSDEFEEDEDDEETAQTEALSNGKEGNKMSLTNNVQDAIDAVLREWIDDKVLFTVHDVKIEVRKRGYWLLHDPCRTYVHAKFENGDFGSNYQRSATYLHTGSGDMYVMVFHPWGVDPTTHTNAITSGAPVSTPVPSPSPTKSANDNEVEVDAKNRIRIPAAVTDSLGWNEGTLVRVAEKNGIVEVAEVNNNCDKTHTVDCYGNIRITLSDPRSKQYIVEVVAQKVVAKPA